ncbi:uncharacterized protein LOC128951866 [Oppia nitens]|uniref:uncharacterized protein LOC128951866 n=1 Tax=Oppia nitens TaxID=1686743 RepID=UPI0023DB7E84|nr:uncharacterized protein LOC128951866 [Oppia nitens]
MSANHYMTEQYVERLLQQYQPATTPRPTPPVVTNNVNYEQQLSTYYGKEEDIRRQLNECLFKSTSETMMPPPVTLSHSALYPRPTGTPLYTSDSFRPPESMSSNGGFATQTSVVSSQYYPQNYPKTMRYNAKVIDYANGMGNTNIAEPMTNQRTVSVLGEQNADLMSLQKGIIESVNALQSVAQRVYEPMIQRPIMTANQPTQYYQMYDNNPEIAKTSTQTFDKITINNRQQKRRKPYNKQPLIQTTPDTVNRQQQQQFDPNIQPNQPSKKPLLSEPPKQTVYTRDTLAQGYENEGIILTTNLDNIMTFYCYYCNGYIKKLLTVAKHCKSYGHKNNIERCNADPMQNTLNKRFLLGDVLPNDLSESDYFKIETTLRIELERISIQNKHYYCRKGVRLRKPGGPHQYHCIFCDKPIQSLIDIESHINTESHRKSEDRPTFTVIMARNTEPVIGLQFINEYVCPDLVEPVYECLLCHCKDNANNMYRHVSSFGHRLKILKILNPEETALNTIPETPQAIKEIKKRVHDLHKVLGTGTIKRIRGKPGIDTSPVKHNNGQQRQQQQQQCKPNSRNIEVIDITGEESLEKTPLQKQLSIRVTNYEDASDIAHVIQTIKKSVVDYYVSKIPPHMKRVLVDKVVSDEDIYENYERFITK